MEDPASAMEPAVPKPSHARRDELSQEARRQLDLVPKSSDGTCTYAPCRVQLRTGEVLDRVYVVPRSQFTKVWGNTRSSVEASEIAHLEESPFRLPVELANQLYAAGESGMGYVLFVATLTDGRTLPFVTGNAVDFPNWPPAVSPADVRSVRPHAGRDVFRSRRPGPYERSARYEWCVFDW